MRYMIKSQWSAIDSPLKIFFDYIQITAIINIEEGLSSILLFPSLVTQTFYSAGDLS